MITVFDPHFWTVLGLLTGLGASATVGLTLLLDALVTRSQHRRAAAKDGSHAPDPASRTRSRSARGSHHAHAH